VANKGELQSKVALLKVIGATNVSSGLQKAIEILETSIESEIQRERRVFLFSDGHDENNSIRLIPDLILKLNKLKAVTATFGIGEGFKEEYMTNIAVSGHGMYYFIAKATDTKLIVAKGMHAVTTLIGKNAVIILDNLKENWEFKILNNTTNKIGDIREQGFIQILFEFSCSSKEALGDLIAIAHYKLEYENLDKNDTHITIEGIINGKESGETPVQITAIVALTEVKVLENEAFSLIDSNFKKKAVDIQISIVSRLKECLCYDNYGFIHAALISAYESLQKYIERNSNLRKHVHYKNYLSSGYDTGYCYGFSDS